MTKYGFSINYGNTSFDVSGCDSLKEAIEICIGMAEHTGWSNPKWWQFWRANDTRVPEEYLNDQS